MIDALGAFDAEKEMVNIVDHNKQKVLDLQREQMMEGRGIDGQFIRPFYSENPYFKTMEQSQAYARWKQKITPNSKRPLDVPNLFINGRFHDSLFVEVGGNEFDIDATDYDATDIMSVHKNAIGLNDASRLEFAEKITIPEFGKVLKEKTGIDI